MREELSPGCVAVIDLALDVALDDRLLDEAEKARAARFVFDRDCRRFIAAHAQLRACLGMLLGRDPAELRFDLGPHGKPFLAGQPLRFNLSHSAERALLAVTPDLEVGVDIEYMRPDVEFHAIARRMFSPEEGAALTRLPESELAEGFYRVWTQKEAFIKLLGDGLAFPLRDFTVSIDAAGGLEGCRVRDVSELRMCSLSAEPGYAAALAVEPAARRLRRYQLSRDGGGASAGRLLPTGEPSTPSLFLRR